MGFKEALAFTLKFEGGYSNHPKDRGGATNFGITQKTYNNFRTKKKQPIRSVKGISPPEVEEIYKKEYWDAIQGDTLPDKLAIAAFDFAVNSGAGRALNELQEAILSSPTLEGRLEHYLDAREQFLRSLPTAMYFLKGWLNRLNALRQLLGVT